VNPPPDGWPRVSAAVYYEPAAQAIEWLCRAFGFEVRIRVDGPGGRVEHSELTFGGGMVMVGEADHPARQPWRRSPGQAGGANTQNLMLYVDDVEAHCQRARAAGAVIAAEPATTDYGEGYWVDRGYECVDPGAHHWWFVQRLRDHPRPGA
jgi:uncharacterized glyoxalase superfamily protein PhnB